jgi:hypothetical protein
MEKISARQMKRSFNGPGRWQKATALFWRGVFKFEV